MMTDKISIPKPCHENWNDMQPEDAGRHCLACSQTVIDFSNWNEVDILNYLQSRNNEKVCGRFNVTQLGATEERTKAWPLIMNSNVSLLKKIAAIVLICFGVMTADESYGQKVKGKPKCTTTTQVPQRQLLGKPAVIKSDTVKATIVDTALFEPQIMGEIVLPPPPKGKPAKKTISPKKSK